MNNNQLTKDDLEKLGIYNLGLKFHPNRYFIPYLGECDLHLPCSFDSICQRIYNSGRDDGIVVGKIQKANEIKKALSIDTEESY